VRAVRRTPVLLAVAAAALIATTPGPGPATTDAGTTPALPGSEGSTATPAAAVSRPVPDAAIGWADDTAEPVGDRADGGAAPDGPAAPASDGPAAPASEGPDAPPGPVRRPATARPEFLVASGGASAGAGRPLRYTVEVEAGIGLDPDLVATEVDAALADPRSWARDRLLERTSGSTGVDARIVVASPEVVDAICAEVGLVTAGRFSCWTGRIAALNAWRWEVGAAGFPDLATYRTYLVNHEVGHALGHGHVGCPEPGAPAPVMMQQSKGLAGCVANGWPYP
jgi:hypothetical protein